MLSSFPSASPPPGSPPVSFSSCANAGDAWSRRPSNSNFASRFRIFVMPGFGSFRLELDRPLTPSRLNFVTDLRTLERRRRHVRNAFGQRLIVRVAQRDEQLSALLREREQLRLLQADTERQHHFFA